MIHLKQKKRCCVFEMMPQRALWAISGVSLRDLYKDLLYLLYTPSMWCLSVKNEHARDREDRKREKKKKSDFFWQRGSDSWIIQSLVGRVRMNGNSFKDVWTWQRDWDVRRTILKQQKKEGKKSNLRTRKWKKKNCGSWVRRWWKKV